jgi:hypothetical protein
MRPTPLAVMVFSAALGVACSSGSSHRANPPPPTTHTVEFDSWVGWKPSDMGNWYSPPDWDDECVLTLVEEHYRTPDEFANAFATRGSSQVADAGLGVCRKPT